MNNRSIFMVLGTIVTLVLFWGVQGQAQSRPRSDGPVITHGFTVEKIMYGDILRVYIEAEDPEGEMVKIATVVDQAGFGRYPTSWVYLKPTDRKHFKGYLQWNTVSSKTPFVSEWTQMTLRVSVFDRSGKESNMLAFPITFESGVRRASSYQAPFPFNQSDVRRLGTIDIDLMDLTIMRGDD